MKDIPLKNNTLEEIASQIKSCNSFVLLPHVNIDGDDMGSMIALCLGLKKLGKSCDSICTEEIPKIFDFLSQINSIRREIPEERFDCAILMECTNLSRLSEGIDLKRLAETVINIDHHPGNTFYGDFNYVDYGASALGEIVYDILQVLEVPLDYNIALSIYSAILSDTGGFQFANTTSRTHAIVSSLLNFPIQVDEVSRHIFRSCDLNVLKLKGEVFSKLKEDDDGRIVYGTLTLDMMERHAVKNGDIQHLIEDINIVRNTEVVVLFKESVNNSIRVSMRSRVLPINEVARKYNGGGHKLAAGFTLEGFSLHDAETEIIKTLKNFIQSHSRI